MYVTLYTGPMKAGKTRRLATAIEKYVLAKKHIVFVQPIQDTRQGSHNSYISKYFNDLVQSPYVTVVNTTDVASVLNLSDEVLQATEPAAIFVDEFFMLEGWSKEFFFRYAQSTLKDVPLILAGISNSWNCDCFKATATVLPFVDKIEREQAVCEICGKPANYHFYKKGADSWVDDSSTIDDECDKFTCMCAECYVKACNGTPIEVDIKE